MTPGGHNTLFIYNLKNNIGLVFPLDIGNRAGQMRTKGGFQVGGGTSGELPGNGV